MTFFCNHQIFLELFLLFFFLLYLRRGYFRIADAKVDTFFKPASVLLKKIAKNFSIFHKALIIKRLF